MAVPATREISEYGRLMQLREDLKKKHGGRGDEVFIQVYGAAFPDEADTLNRIAEKYDFSKASDLLLESLLGPARTGFGDLRAEEAKPVETLYPRTEEPPTARAGFGDLRAEEATQAKEIGMVINPMLEQEERQAEERKVEEMLTGAFGPEPQRPAPDFGELRRAAKPPEVLRGEQAYESVLGWLREESKQWPEPTPLRADPQWEQKLRTRLTDLFYPDDLIEASVEMAKTHGTPLIMTLSGIPEYDPGLSVKDTASGMKVFLQGLALLPKPLAAALLTRLQGRRGASVVNKGWADKKIEQYQADSQKFYQEALKQYKNKKFMPGIKITDVAQLPQNLAFTGVSMGSGALAGGLVGVGTALLPVPGARAAALKVGTAVGAAAAGEAAFQMASYQFMQEFLEQKDAEVFEQQGRHITQIEEDRLKNEFDHLAVKHGLWEAIPEAIGGAAGFSILIAPLQKVVGKSLAARMLTKFAAIYGEEAATETVTELGQTGVRKEAGLPGGRDVDWDNPREWMQAFKDIAPGTFLLTAVTAGAGSVVVNTAQTAHKIAKLKQEVGEDSPLYTRLLNKVVSIEARDQMKHDAEFVDGLVQELAAEQPKHVEVAEADGVQRTMLEGEALPVVEPGLPAPKRATLAEGEVILAPVRSGGQDRLLKVEIIDASDPSTVTVRTESGTEFRTGRKNIKLLDEVTTEEPEAAPAEEVAPPAPVDEAVEPKTVGEKLLSLNVGDRVFLQPHGLPGRIIDISPRVTLSPDSVDVVNLHPYLVELDDGTRVHTTPGLLSRRPSGQLRVEAPAAPEAAPEVPIQERPVRPAPKKPVGAKPVAPTKQTIGPLTKGMPEGYFGDGVLIVKGKPPQGAEFGTAEIPTPEDVTELLKRPTVQAQETYYLSISDQDVNVSGAPIAVDPDTATPCVIYKSANKYFAYNQYKHNVLKKRFPNARFGVTPATPAEEHFDREGMLVAYEKGEPVGALMPFKIQGEEAAMTQPPGLEDAMDLGLANLDVVFKEPAPAELDQIEGQTEQEFIDESPPIGQSIRRIIPPEVKGKIIREERDISGFKGDFLRLGPARTLAMWNPTWNQIIHQARDTTEGMVVEQSLYSERLDKLYKPIKSKEDNKLFVELQQTPGRPDNIPPQMVSAYDEITAIKQEAYNMARDMGIEVEKWGMTPEDFWPHIFVGKWHVVTPQTNKEGKTEWHTIDNGFARTTAEAIDKAVAFHEENPDADFMIKPKNVRGSYSAVPLSRKGFWNFIGEIEKATELDKEEVLSMMKGVAKIKPRGKFVGNFMQRTANLGGYVEDKLAMKIYMNRVLRKKWLDPFNKKATDLAMSLPPALKQYALEYIDSIVGVYNPYDADYRASRVVSKLTRAESVMKLGYRPITAMVNRLQPMQLAFPEIGHYLWRGWSYKHKDEGKQIIEESGILGDMPYYAAGEMGAYVRRIGKILHSLGLFTKAEMENRKDVICGGYLFAKKIFAKDRVKGEKQGFDYIYKYLDQYEGDQHKAALEYAKDLNADVNFIYSNADLPNMFKTVKGKLFLQFKTYPINYLATTMKWTLQKPNNVHYYTRLARLAGTTIVLGGARSLPYVGKGMFYGVLFGGLDDPPETSKAYKAGQFLQAAVLNPVVTALLPESSREYTRKVLARGIFATMGIDLSTRMGPNEFIPENWRQLGGPFVNDLVSFYEYSQGDISWKQFLRIVPAVRDINTALAANEYITDPNRRERNVVRVLGWERMLEGIGAPSTRRQVARDVQAMTAEMQRGYSENKANYIDDAIAQLRSIDQTQDLKAINKAESVVFNKVLAEAAEEGIYIAPTDILSEMDRKHDTVLLRAYDMAPIDLRPELEQKFEQVRKLYGIEMFY